MVSGLITDHCILNTGSWIEGIGIILLQAVCRRHRKDCYRSPGTLSADDTYAVSAYILSLNRILPADGKLDQDNLSKIKMPNWDGFIPDPVFRIDNEQEAPNKRGETP